MLKVLDFHAPPHKIKNKKAIFIEQYDAAAVFFIFEF
jgi:hypothetical protein